jgi:hypothetical protein
MIDDEQYSSFKFDGDGDEEPNSEQTIYQEEAKDRRVEKLSHRVTIISILIPVLIGVVFYIRPGQPEPGHRGHGNSKSFFSTGRELC